MGLHLEPGGEGAQDVAADSTLELADALVAVQHLALQIAEPHPIETTRVRWLTPATARYWLAAQPRPPGADDQHAGLLERLLPLEVEGFYNDLAVVAKEFGVAPDPLTAAARRRARR